MIGSLKNANPLDYFGDVRTNKEGFDLRVCPLMGNRNKYLIPQMYLKIIEHN